MLKSNRLLVPVLGMLLLVAASLGYIAFSLTNMATDPAKPFDLKYIDFMIPRHQEFITIADESLLRIEHQELRDLMTNLRRLRLLELRDLRLWRGMWYGPSDSLTVPADEPYSNLPQPYRTLDQDLGALSQSNEPFDKILIEVLMFRYRTVINASTMVSSEGQHFEIRYFARTVAEDGERDMAALRTWHQLWYGGAGR